MAAHLPKPIARFMASENTNDPDAVVACFASDATVTDEGRVRWGLSEIAAWRRETEAKYHPRVTPIAAAERSGKTVVTTEISGDFPGSPVTVDFVFELEDGKIASLWIG